jgi:hypothetical protein
VRSRDHVSPWVELLLLSSTGNGHWRAIKSSLGRSTSNRNIRLLQFGVLIAHAILALLVSVETLCLIWTVLAKSLFTMYLEVFRFCQWF